MPPHVPQDPAAHMLPVMVPHTWPLATQRLKVMPEPRMQQPPPAHVLFGQQGWSGPPQRAQTPPVPLSWQMVVASLQRVSVVRPLLGQHGSPGPPQPPHLPAWHMPSGSVPDMQLWPAPTHVL
jgi:hypothetical protein